MYAFFFKTEIFSYLFKITASSSCISTRHSHLSRNDFNIMLPHPSYLPDVICLYFGNTVFSKLHPQFVGDFILFNSMLYRPY